MGLELAPLAHWFDTIQSMKPRQPADVEPLLRSYRSGVTLERRVLPGRDGLVLLEQIFRGSGEPVIVTHNTCVVSIVEVKRGSMMFSLPSGLTMAPERFLLLLPPRTVLPLFFQDACVRTKGVSGCFTFVHKTPVVSPCPPGDVRWSMQGVERAVQLEPMLRLDPDLAVPPAVVRARHLLHELMAHPAPVRMAARRVGMSAEALTRAFTRAYRIPPKRYCHRVRLFQAVLSLLSGAVILDAALTSGFRDLTRFYTQFRRLVGGTPGAYARVRKRQDSRAELMP